MNDADLEELQAALQRYGLSVPESQVPLLQAYCRGLWEWNERLNLTRHTDWDKFVSRDLLDTIHLAEQLESGEAVLDVGTGGGVPGVVLAILRPDLNVSLAESVGKKARAVEAILEPLELSVTVYAQRAEQVLAERRFDALVARAVGPLWKMCTWLQPHWHAFGRLLAIKGPAWVEERRTARERGLLNGVQLRRVATYPMPGTHSESVILKLWSED